MCWLLVAILMMSRFSAAGLWRCWPDRAARRTLLSWPDLVITNAPSDYLVDHEETSRLVRNAAFIATVPNYDCGFNLSATAVVPHLYYANAIGRRDIFGRPLPLTCAVNVAETIKVKASMLTCHASQREWLRDTMQCDYIDMMMRTSAAEGEPAGFDFAEGFIQHLGDGYPQNNIFKEMFGDDCHVFG